MGWWWGRAPCPPASASSTSRAAARVRRPHLPQRVQSENLPGPSLRGPRTKTLTDCFLKPRCLGFKRLKRVCPIGDLLRKPRKLLKLIWLLNKKLLRKPLMILRQGCFKCNIEKLRDPEKSTFIKATQQLFGTKPRESGQEMA